MIALAVGIRNARLQQIAQALDSAPSGGQLHLITEPRAEAGALLSTQTVLASLRLSNPCTANLQGGNLSLTPMPAAMAQRSGIAAWARFTNGDGTWVMDVDVGLISDMQSTAEVKLDHVQLYAGGLVTVTLAEFVE
jgi:hypothetical protein